MKNNTNKDGGVGFYGKLNPTNQEVERGDEQL